MEPQSVDNRSKGARAAGRYDYLYAVVIVAAVCAAMVMVFEVRFDRPDAQTRRQGNVFSLPDPPQHFGEDRPVLRERNIRWQRQLLAWAEVWDPTTMSLPNSERGFSRIRRFEFVRPVKLHQVDEPGRVMAMSTPVTLPVIVPPLNDLDSAVTRAMLLMPPVIVAATRPPREIPTGVVITDGHGRIVDTIAPLVVETSTVRRTITGPTVLHVYPRRHTARIQLVQSCGDGGLDRLASSHLFRHYAMHIAAMSATASESAAERVYHVHWQFLADIDDGRESVTGEAIWHQEAWE